VIDLDLPIMDGFELVRACRAEDGTRLLTIVVVSAVFRGERVEALSAHAFLPKPIDVATLVATLGDVVP
jgi:CheY-like chemotaxis protein